MYIWCLSGIKTTENPPGPWMHTHSPSITGVSWLQDWPSSYSSRLPALIYYLCLLFYCNTTCGGNKQGAVHLVKPSAKVFVARWACLFFIWQIHPISLTANVSRCLHISASRFDEHSRSICLPGWFLLVPQNSRNLNYTNMLCGPQMLH